MQEVMARLVSDPRERFAAALAAVLRQIDALPEATVRAILAELDRTRRRVLAELLDVAPGGYDAYRLAQLDARLLRLMQDFVDRYQIELSGAQARMYGLGAELPAQPLQAAGLNVYAPLVGRLALEAARDYQASLITSVADSTIRTISSMLRAGLLRGEPWPDIMRRIARWLPDPGPFGSMARRAEAITRTELGRIQALASQASMEQMVQRVPDLKKQWQHSRNRWDPRLGHIEAEGQLRDVHERFHVRPGPGFGYEDLLYPRDPGATPQNVVNCGCVAVPYRAAWAEFERQQAARRRLVPA